MKPHHGLCFGLLSLLVCANRLPAQTDKPLDEIPMDVGAANQLNDVQRQEVHQYVIGWTALLQDQTNPIQQGTARNRLVSGTAPGGNDTTTTAYQAEYAGDVNDALLPLLKNPSLRVRLLAGIVAGRVADRMNNTKLEPMAIALLQDKSDAVVLWGMRTARFVLPWLLRNPAQNSTLPVVMATALGSHPQIPIADDAYNAANLLPGDTDVAVQAAAQEILRFLQARVGVYRKVCPVDPSADATGTTFLSIRAWPLMTPAQHLDAVQQISDLLSVMAQRCITDGSQLLMRTLDGLQHVAGAIYAIGTTEQAPDVVNAAKPVAQQHFQPQTPPQDIVALVQKIYPALKAVPEFAKLNPPPTIETPAAPTSQPAESNH